MTAQDIANEWAADAEEKQQLLIRSGLPLRWLNQGQLRFADKSEILRSIWLPSIPSGGSIALPTDFLREFPDRVKKDSTSTSAVVSLKKIDYADANLRIFSTLTHYSIYNGVFYVWAAGVCSPSIPYIRKPTEMTSLSVNLEIPTQFQHNLIIYMDAQWSRGKDIGAYYALLDKFDNQARQDGVVNIVRNDRIPTVRGSWF